MADQQKPVEGEYDIPSDDVKAKQHTVQQGSTVPPAGDHHEYRDINFRGVIQFAVVLAILIVVSMLAMWGMFELFEAHTAENDPAPSPMKDTARMAPDPALQHDPVTDLKKFRAQQDSITTTYGWVDKQQGIVRIPVERAMEIVLQQGLPTYVMTADETDMMFDDTSAEAESNDTEEQTTSNDTEHGSDS